MTSVTFEMSVLRPPLWLAACTVELVRPMPVAVVALHIAADIMGPAV